MNDTTARVDQLRAIARRVANQGDTLTVVSKALASEESLLHVACMTVLEEASWQLHENQAALLLLADELEKRAAEGPVLQ